MRIVANIPSELVDDIREAVEQGDYEGPEEFLERALRTQIELEEGDQDPVVSFSEAVGSEKSTSQEPTTLDSASPQSTESADDAQGSLPDLSIESDGVDVHTVPPADDDRIDTGPLWGQYNRLFPVMLTVRRLALVLHDRSASTLPYDEFRETTAGVARTYGLQLEEIDDEKGRKRGEKFSAALPTGDKADQSLARFKTHFVGQIDNSGSLTGAPPILKFLNVDPETQQFGLTEAGREFARIENPLLDDDLRRDTSLSDTERRFYLDHVATSHPAEYNAMQTVAEAVIDGITRPDPLSEHVSRLSEDWSQAQASTVRSGLIGRMYELGLITRKRVGSRGVGYEVTDRGRTNSSHDSPAGTPNLSRPGQRDY